MIEDLINDFSNLQLTQFSTKTADMAPTEIRRSERLKKSTKTNNYVYFDITNSSAHNFKKRKKKLTTKNIRMDSDNDDQSRPANRFNATGRGRGINSLLNNSNPGGLQDRPPGVNTISNPYNNTRPDKHSINVLQRSPQRQKPPYQFTNKQNRPIAVFDQHGNPVLPYDQYNHPIRLLDQNNKPQPLCDKEGKPIALYDDKYHPINQEDLNIANTSDVYEQSNDNLGATGGAPKPTNQYPSSAGNNTSSLNMEGNLRESERAEFERKQLEELANQNKNPLQLPPPIAETAAQKEIRESVEKAKNDERIAFINKHISKANKAVPLIDMGTPDRVSTSESQLPNGQISNDQLSNNPNNGLNNNSTANTASNAWNPQHLPYSQVYQNYPIPNNPGNNLPGQPN